MINVTQQSMYTKEPKIAFIIVCWNNQKLLAECFDSIKNQSYKNYHVVMIDNGSKDNSVKFTKENYKWVDVIEAGENLGFAKGNNRAIAEAVSLYDDIEYFILLNTDAVLQKDWLKKMVEFATKKPKGALFQGTTLDYYAHDIIDSSHIFINHSGQAVQANWRTLYRGELGPQSVFGVNAAACLVSKKFIDHQPFDSLFDEHMFMYLEDVDMAARAIITGWNNYLVPGALAYHMGSASSGKNSGFSLYLTYRNNIALLVKNIPTRLLIKMIPRIMRADFHTIRHLYRLNQAKGAHKLIKGRIIGLLRLPVYTVNIYKMRRYRRSISKQYLWHLMKDGR